MIPVNWMIPGSVNELRPRVGLYGVGSAAFAGSARRRLGGPAYHFREIHMKIGVARKIDEYVQTITPTFIANAKFFTRPVPKMFMMSVVANTVEDVRIVRTSISLSEISTMRSIFLSLSLC